MNFKKRFLKLIFLPHAIAIQKREILLLVTLKTTQREPGDNTYT